MSPTMTSRQRLLTPSQAAAHLNISVRHIRRLKDERKIEFVKVGRFVRFDPVALDRYIDEHTTPASNR